MIRKATTADLSRILEIYCAARSFMAASGNPDQWGDSHPPADMVAEDIRLGQLYADEVGGRLCGVFMFARKDEPMYARIEDGAWLSDTPYGVIHRVASDGTARGMFGRCVEFCKARCSHLRMDTYVDNKRMQALISGAGFARCGMVRADGKDFIVYEWLEQ